MARIILPKHYHHDFSVPGKQPRGKVEVDWTNPISHGLVSAYIAGQSIAFDILGNAISYNGVIRPPIIIDQGIVVAQGDPATGGSEQDRSITIENRISDYSTITCLVSTRPDGAGNYFGSTGINYFVNAASPGNQGWGYYKSSAHGATPTNTGKPSLAIFGVALYTPIDPNLKGANYQTHGVAFNSGGTAEFYSDGKQHGNSISIGTLKPPSDHFTIGANQGLASQNTVSKTEFCLIFNRKLSPEEHASLNADPYQLFKPAIMPSYFTTRPYIYNPGGGFILPDGGFYTDNGEDQILPDGSFFSPPAVVEPPAEGRIMSSLTSDGGLAGTGGLAGKGGGLAG